MRHTTPEVYCIGQPQLNWNEIERYLDSVGGGAWLDRMSYKDGSYGRKSKAQISDAEALVEFAGRGCYKSWDVGLNPNVTRVRTDSEQYLGNILNTKHGSVLEHAQFSFVFENVSRVFTHELVRHRAGVAISQESMRYVRLADIGFWTPPVLADGPEMINPLTGTSQPMGDVVTSMVEILEEFQVNASNAYQLDDDGIPFDQKKLVTSALRRLAPDGVSTQMTWSSNVRTLRFVIELRTAKSAEEEIRVVFDQVARVMKDKCPLLFQDFEPNSDGEWVSGSWKV